MLARHLFRRCFATAAAEEIQLTVPWGHVSGLAFGPVDGHPVLAVHGWLDNATSFVDMQKHLPRDIRLVAIDLPGHGFSSHRPAGTKYSFLDWVNGPFICNSSSFFSSSSPFQVFVCH